MSVRADREAWALHQSAPTFPTPRKYTPPHADTAPGERIDFPLATAPPASTIAVPIEKTLWVRVKDLVPAKHYRITIVDKFFPKGRTIDRPPLHPLSKPAPAPPPCNVLAQDAIALFETTEEAAVPSRATRVASVELNEACREIFFRTRTLVEAEHRTEAARVSHGETVTVRVERLSLVNREIERTWTLTLVGARDKPAWPASSEMAWVVQEIARDVAEMAVYAKERALPSDPVVAELRGNVLALRGPLAFEQTFVPEPHVWAPQAFQGLAKKALSGSATAPARRIPTDPALPARLSDARLSTLKEESARLAKRLSTDMRDAGAHEEAALVLGALALREARGPYADVRPVMNRMTAHLAMALALRPEAGLSRLGGLADVLLRVLAHRGADAQAALRGLAPGTDGGMRSWVAALELRVTQDYRAARPWKAASDLERLERFRALVKTVSTEKALSLLDAVDPAPVGDWGLLALSEVSVEAANAFGPSVVSTALSEARSVLSIAAEDPRAIVTSLRVPAERCVSVEANKAKVSVVGTGQWAAFFARRVLTAAHESYQAAVLTLGQPEMAASLQVAYEQALGELPGYPLLELRLVEMAEQAGHEESSRPLHELIEKACDSIGPILAEQPQVVSYASWRAHDNMCPGSRAGRPQEAQWFSELFLPGTAYDAFWRLSGPLPDKYGLEAVGKLRDLSPFEERLRNIYVIRTAPDPAPVAKWIELHRPLSDYSASSLRVIASWARSRSPQERLTVYRPLCQLDETSCLELADTLALAGLEDEAAAVFRKAFADNRNKVASTHYARWLADYELRHGRTESALSLAKKAAETYSGAGLIAYAEVLELVGRLDEARATLDAYTDRYRDPMPLAQFILRSYFGRHDERSRRQAEALVKAAFPQGLQRVSLAELPVPPSRGVVVVEETDASRRIGVQFRDVVVALDGYRVETDRQYMVVQAMRLDPKISLILWRRDRYVELQADVPGRSFRSELATWDGRP